MSQPLSSLTPQSPPAKPANKWRWLKITAGFMLGSFLILKLIANYGDTDLEVTRKGAFTGDDGRLMQVVNVGTNSVTIIKATVNDRADCSVRRTSWLYIPGTGDDPKPFQPIDLNVGDTVLLVSSCQVVRATLNTNRGSNSSSFGR